MAIRNIMNRIGLFCATMIGSSLLTLQAVCAASLSADVSAASDGNILVGYEGRVETEEVDKLLNRINAIRKEAYNEGLVSKYVAISWDSDLEKTARLRAVEASINMDHMRPSVVSSSDSSLREFSTVTYTKYYAECLDWNSSGGMLVGVEDWYEEKADYVLSKNGGSPSGPTGHYGCLINPAFTKIGIGGFYDGGKWHTTVADFGMGTAGNTAKDSTSGSYVQILEVGKAYTTLDFKGCDSLIPGQTYQTNLSLTYYKSSKTYNEVKTLVPQNLTYTSSNPSVATIDANGKITALASGTTKITVNCGMTKSFTLTVCKLTSSSSYKDTGSKAIYSIKEASSGGYVVTYKKPINTKAKTIKVPNTITVSGVKLPVTGIYKNAFAKCKKVKTIVLGKNVKEIGKKAFYKCKKLKNLKIQGKLLSKVGKKALPSQKLKVIVKYKSFKSKYKKLLKKGGLHKKSTIK